MLEIQPRGGFQNELYYMMVTCVYLCAGIRVMDGLLQMTHEQQVARLEPVVVQRMVVHVAEDRTRTQSVRGVVGVDELAQLLHHVHGRLDGGIDFSLKYNSFIPKMLLIKFVSCNNKT